MSYELTPYSIMYLTAALIAAAVAPFAWRRRSAPGFLWLFLMLAAMVEWNLCDAMEQSVIELSGHIFWSQMSYFGSAFLAVFLFLFAMDYTGRNRHLSRWTIPLLFIVPVLVTAGAFTNDWHHLIWTDVVRVAGSEHLYVYQHGLLYWLISLYSFALMGAVTVVMAGFAYRNRNVYRYQSAGIILAIIIPWIVEIGYDTMPGLLPGMDRAAVLAVSGVILAVCILRFRLLDLVPVARQKLVESLTDGMIAVDGQKRIIDYNPAASRLFDLPGKKSVGMPVPEALSSWPELTQWLCGLNHTDDDDAAGDQTFVSPEGRYISVQLSSLRDKRDNRTGRIFIFRDVTNLKETEKKLQLTAGDLKVRLDEIESLHAELAEQAISDPLTALYNRRYLAETLVREFSRAAREGYPVSLVMIDIDFFKDVNDTFGHTAGDLLLRDIGKHLRADTRPGDFACRYGGDEFLVVMPNTSAGVAAKRAEEWRHSFERNSVSLKGMSISVTASMGVAERPSQGKTADEVLSAADDAVYIAKAKGRNQVVMSTRKLSKAA